MKTMICSSDELAAQKEIERLEANEPEDYPDWNMDTCANDDVAHETPRESNYQQEPYW